MFRNQSWRKKHNHLLAEKVPSGFCWAYCDVLRLLLLVTILPADFWTALRALVCPQRKNKPRSCPEAPTITEMDLPNWMFYRLVYTFCPRRILEFIGTQMYPGKPWFITSKASAAERHWMPSGESEVWVPKKLPFYGPDLNIYQQKQTKTIS